MSAAPRWYLFQGPLKKDTYQIIHPNSGRCSLKTVVLLRKPKTSSAKTGVGIYTDGVAKLLDNNAIEYGEIELRMDLHSGFERMLVDGFIRPFFQIMNARKDTKIFHSADEFSCFFFPLLRNNKKIVTFHHVVSEDDKDSRFPLAWKFVSWVGVRWADKIVAISEQTRDEILKKYKIDESKVVVISNKLTEDIRILSAEKKRYVGCVSTFAPRKNVGSLLRVFKEFRDSYGMDDYLLKICGKGPEEGMLRKLTKDLGLEGKVEFLSNLERNELVSFYSEASIIANPSMHEGFGRITLEAQLCSTPVVYFEKAEIPEEVTRRAVPSVDEKDFAFNMYKLLTDQEFYKKVVEEGLEHARSFQGQQAELIEIYRELSA